MWARPYRHSVSAVFRRISSALKGKYYKTEMALGEREGGMFVCQSVCHLGEGWKGSMFVWPVCQSLLWRGRGACLSVSQSVCQPVCQSVCLLSVRLSLCKSVCLSVLPVLPACLSVCLCVSAWCVCVCVCVCLRACVWGWVRVRADLLSRAAASYFSVNVARS
jgi:hypothetical protein